MTVTEHENKELQPPQKKQRIDDATSREDTDINGKVTKKEKLF